MKRALITGINGMDGSHLADFLIRKKGIESMVWKDIHQLKTELIQNI